MNSTLFTDAMALTPAGDGVYDGELNEHWTIGPKVHGGRCWRCARTRRSRSTAERRSKPIAVVRQFPVGA